MPYNHELQWYVNPSYVPSSNEPALANPFSISNGILNITAAPATASVQPFIHGQQYTSGMISTVHEFSQTYGYFEMRAVLPAGQGLLPAFWLLPADGSWPPELDVMEMLGSDPTRIYTTAHSKASGTHTMISSSAVVSDASAAFHTYGVDWQPDLITWYIDGHQTFQTPTPSDMNKPMYMIANLAVGGDWPGSPDATTMFPATMQIDYIRAYSDRPAIIQSLFTLPTSGLSTHEFYGTAKTQTLKGTLGNDFIDGRGGGDKMDGGAGDDIYMVRDLRDSVIEKAGAGIDTVQSYVSSYTLPANVENLSLKAGFAQNATGNDLNNILIGNDFNSVLNGGAGNDILIAGRGLNTLTGGSGNDIFVFNALPTNPGHVTDFSPGKDMVDLRGLFSGAGYHGTNPIADGYLILTDHAGSGSDILFDPDGSGPNPAFQVITLDHVLGVSLHLQSDLWFV